MLNNDFTVASSGLTPSTDISSPLPTTPIKAHLGHANGPAPAINGHLRSVRVYPTRVPDPELIRITI